MQEIPDAQQPRQRREITIKQKYIPANTIVPIRIEPRILRVSLPKPKRYIRDIKDSIREGIEAHPDNECRDNYDRDHTVRRYGYKDPEVPAQANEG